MVHGAQDVVEDLDLDLIAQGLATIGTTRGTTMTSTTATCLRRLVDVICICAIITTLAAGKTALSPFGLWIGTAAYEYIIMIS